VYHSLRVGKVKPTPFQKPVCHADHQRGDSAIITHLLVVGKDDFCWCLSVPESLVTTELRGTENQKNHCGERHFNGALGVDYKVITSADELP